MTLRVVALKPAVLIAGMEDTNRSLVPCFGLDFLLRRREPRDWSFDCLAAPEVVSPQAVPLAFGGRFQSHKQPV